MKYLQRVVVLFILLAVLPAAPALSAKAAASASADFLNSDGTLRMEALQDGALDLRGWDVQLDPVLGPVLQPAALNGTWSGLGSGITGGEILAIAVSGSNVYVGGVFTSAGGIAVNNIAVWNSTTSTWSALGSGVNGGLGSGVDAIAVSGSNVYVGGSFTSAGGIAASYIAVWNSATSTWSGLGSGIGSGVAVHAIAVSGSNVYVGGAFSLAGGIAVNNIAVWNSTTSTWSALGSGLDSSVRAIAVSGSNVYAGGDFTHAGAVAAYYIAVWNGSAWSALGGGVNNQVHAMDANGSNIYVGGWFTTAGGIAANYIAAWDSTTSTWSALGSGLASSPEAIAISGSNVYVGGFFPTAGGIAVRRIAVWNSTTSTWSALGSGVYPGVYAIDVGGSNVYAGGTINDAGGVAVNLIARFQVDPPTVVFGAVSIPPSEGANLTTGPSQLVVRYSKDVLHDGSPKAANSLWNYMLLRPGPNGVFDTPISTFPPGIDPICDSDHVREGDDERIDLLNVTYNAASFAATLTIDPLFAPLANGTYRLYLCGAASIEDLDGLSLNGGANSAINFTVGPAPVVPAAARTAGKRVPNTGFAPGQVTILPAQTVSYSELGDLWLEVPKLGLKMSIVGVPRTNDAWDVSWLGSKAGWLEGSAYPSWKGNSVLTGHVWNADNSAGPFRYLNTLWWGDKVIVHVSGQQYIYEVRAVKQVAPTDVSAMLKHEELSWLTLVTCKSYDEKTDNYRYRILVRAVLVEVK